MTSALDNLAGPGGRVLAKCHEIRNRGEYEGDLNVDDRLVKDLVIACKTVAGAVKKLAPLSQ